MSATTPRSTAPRPDRRLQRRAHSVLRIRMRDMRGLAEARVPAAELRAARLGEPQRRVGVRRGRRARSSTGASLVPFCPQSELSGVGQTRSGRRASGTGGVSTRRRLEAPAAAFRRGRLSRHGLGQRGGGGRARGRPHALLRRHQPCRAAARQRRRRSRRGPARGPDDPARQAVLEARRPRRSSTRPTTGIWQTVWLEPLPERSIAGLRIDPDLDAGAVDVEIEADGARGRSASRSTATRSGAGRARPRVASSWRAVTPWSPETPHLYDGRRHAA